MGGGCGIQSHVMPSRADRRHSALGLRHVPGVMIDGRVAAAAGR
jgi:hypothetical protein